MLGKKEEALRLVLYTRPGCHLCELMKEEIARARLEVCTLEEVDVDTDPALAAEHGRSIPVLEIDGRAAFKGRCTAEELRRKVSRARRAQETT
jgi:hypothetical protein